MKIVIDIDSKSLDWLKGLIANSYANTQKGPVNSSLFDSIPYIEAWHKALNEPQVVSEATIVAPEKPLASAKPMTVREKNKLAKQKKKEKEAKAVFTCPTHKTYHGERSPRSDCDDCWELYGIKNGLAQAAAKRAAFRRKLNLKN